MFGAKPTEAQNSSTPKSTINEISKNNTPTNNSSISNCNVCGKDKARKCTRCLKVAYLYFINNHFN